MQRGIALVIVLWMLVLLSIIATGFVTGTRTEIQLAQNLGSAARAEALADAGVNKAIYELSRAHLVREPWSGNGAAHPWAFQGENIAITITDESGKIDINVAPEALLSVLFRAAGAPDDGSAALVDAVMDWRDADNLKRLHGAELDDYVAAGRAVRPANAPFSSTDELRLVIGVTETLYRRLAPWITIHSKRAGIDPALAPRAILEAFPGATPEAVEAYLAARDSARAEGRPVPVFGPAAAFATAGTQVYGIQSKVELKDRTAFIREAIVRAPAGSPVPPVVLAWRQVAVDRAGTGAAQ